MVEIRKPFHKKVSILNHTTMKNKKSPLDIFLQKRIAENKEILKHNLDSSLQEEQSCLEEIVNGINHSKNNIEICNKALYKISIPNMTVLKAKKEAFKDNLVIWNTLGHVQMASIEMKRYTKVLTLGSDNWERQNNIKSAYTAIYETSKNLVDSTGKLIAFLKEKLPKYDISLLKEVRKKLTKFREDKTETLTSVRNKIDAHRDKDVCVQIETLENLHLADAVQLIIDYMTIINELGKAVSPIKQMGIKLLQNVFSERM